MSRDITREFLEEKCVNDVRLVVRHSLIEALVENQQVTRRACIRKLNWGHQLAPARWIARRKTETPAQLKIISVRIGNRSRNVLRVAVRPRRTRSCSGPMAVAALKLHVWTICRLPDRLHMQLVIQFYRAGVGVAFLRCVEFGMAVLKAAYAGREMRFAAPHQ